MSCRDERERAYARAREAASEFVHTLNLGIATLSCGIFQASACMVDLVQQRDWVSFDKSLLTCLRFVVSLVASKKMICFTKTVTLASQSHRSTDGHLLWVSSL
jgi:hypothetical protein